MLYVPALRPSIRKLPFESAFTVLTSLPSRRAVTVARAIAPPLLFRTFPLIPPRADTDGRRRKAESRRRRIFPLFIDYAAADSPRNSLATSLMMSSRLRVGWEPIRRLGFS